MTNIYKMYDGLECQDAPGSSFEMDGIDLAQPHDTICRENELLCLFGKLPLMQKHNPCKWNIHFSSLFIIFSACNRAAKTDKFRSPHDHKQGVIVIIYHDHGSLPPSPIPKSFFSS